MAKTRGKVNNVQWQFNNEPRQYISEFYVRDATHLEVLLGADFLFDTKAYARYGDCFSDSGDSAIVDDEYCRENDADHQCSLIREVWKDDGWLSHVGRGVRRRREGYGILLMEERSQLTESLHRPQQ